MEISLLSSGVKEGGKACIKKGKWAGGKVPFGYVPLEVKNHLESGKKRFTKLQISEFESKIVKRVYELYAQGHGYRSTAQIMNEEYGFIKWTKSKIEGIIKNQTYTGEVFWDEIAKDREERNLSKDSYYYSTEYILKNKLLCSKCKRIMKPKNPGNNQKRVYKCANNIEQRSECNTIIPCNQVEEEFIEYMQKNIISIGSTNRLWSIYSNDFDEKIKAYKELVGELEPRIKQSEETIKKIDALLAEKYKERKKYKIIINSLELQHSVYSNLIEEYKNTKEMLENRAKIDKKSEEEFSNLVKDFIPSLFIKIKSKELNRLRREFVIKFIDSIEVSYDKKIHRVNIDKIVFLPPESI